MKWSYIFAMKCISIIHNQFWDSEICVKVFWGKLNPVSRKNMHLEEINMFSWFLRGLWFPSLEYIESTLRVIICRIKRPLWREIGRLSKWQIFIIYIMIPGFSFFSTFTAFDFHHPSREFFPLNYVINFLEENGRFWLQLLFTYISITYWYTLPQLLEDGNLSF